MRMVAREQISHFKYIITRTLLLSLSVMVLSCTAPAPQIDKSDLLHQALLENTGYTLGEATVQEENSDRTSCAVESRYGNTKSGAIARYVCVIRGDVSQRVTFRVNFTTPEAGHKIWKIDATFPNKQIADLTVIRDLERQYGTPHKVESPLTLTWQREMANLSVREDRYGVHIQLWDRGLR